MTRNQSAAAGDPSGLDRDGLLALVRDLQVQLAERQAAIDRLEARLAELQPRASQPAAPARASAMKPVAGADYTIVFDGGSLGNPGKGYGSYQIVDRTGGVLAAETLQYGDRVSNNSAEYRSLIAALERLLDHLGPTADASSVAIRGDSQLVVKQVNGLWKVNAVDLKPFHRRASDLMRAFGRADLQWHRRNHSVRVLGH